MNEREAFGVELRRIRERRGLSLEQLSDQTKVSVSHYSGLEAGDLSRWPTGIFRRAFVRSYATALGLDPDQVVAQFNRIFPDPTEGPRAAVRVEAALREEAMAAAQEGGASSDELSMFRLALDPPRRPYGLDRLRAAWPRLASAAIDVVLALVPATLAALTFGRSWFVPTAAVVAVLGHLAYYSLTGTTPGSRVVSMVYRRFFQGPGRAGGRRQPAADDSTASRRPPGGHSSGQPSSHAHRVQH